MKTIILWDSCVLADKFIYRNHKVRNEFDRLYLLSLNGFIDFHIPKAVQAEFYGLLRSGGIKVRLVQGDSFVPYSVPHGDLMKLTQVIKLRNASMVPLSAAPQPAPLGIADFDP